MGAELLVLSLVPPRPNWDQCLKLGVVLVKHDLLSDPSPPHMSPETSVSAHLPKAQKTAGHLSNTNKYLPLNIACTPAPEEFSSTCSIPHHTERSLSTHGEIHFFGQQLWQKAFHFRGSKELQLSWACPLLANDCTFTKSSLQDTHCQCCS